MVIVFALCKKSTSSSAAKHQLQLIFVAIRDTAHTVLQHEKALCVPLATSRPSR